MKELQRFHYRTLRYILIAVISLIILYILIFFAVTPEILLNYRIAIVILPPIVLLALASGAFYTKKTHEAATRLLKDGQTTTFRNKDFDVESKYGKYTYSYNVLLKACETKNMFYLYISMNTTVPISKDSFISGTPEDLRCLLRNNMHEKNSKSLWR